MRFPNPEMLVYIAMADAYGMAGEFYKLPGHAEHVEEMLLFVQYLSNPKHPDHHASKYTDDAEMSAANAQVLINGPYTELAFADAYVAEFNRGGRRTGYARRFQAFLEQVRNGEQFLAEIHSDSDKNGAAMRSVPFGVMKSVSEVLGMATLQAKITHNTPAGLFSARAVALMSHYTLYETGPLDQIGAYCLQHLPPEDIKTYGYVFKKDWLNLPVMSIGDVPVSVTTVHAVVRLLQREPTLMKMLELAITLGGDVDSVIAIAWGIASARLREENIPEFFKRDLEKGNPYTGTEYLLDIGNRLMDLFV